VRADLLVLGVLALAVTVVGCSDQTMSATDYVKAHAKDANSVVVSVQEIQLATGIYADAPDPAAAVTFQGIMSDAKNSVEKVKQSILAPDTPPSGLEEARTRCTGQSTSCPPPSTRIGPLSTSRSPLNS
jgi:hypothetical protein